MPKRIRELEWCKICGEPAFMYGCCEDCYMAKRKVEDSPEVRELRQKQHELYRSFISGGEYKSLQDRIDGIVRRKSEELKKVTKTAEGKPIIRVGGKEIHRPEQSSLAVRKLRRKEGVARRKRSQLDPRPV
jgi:hypothetical protein